LLVCTSELSCFEFVVVIFEVLERAEPYKGYTPSQVAVGVANATITLAIDTSNSPPYKAKVVELMRHCMNRDPALRPTWKDVCAALSSIDQQFK
jgi:hypothetical protein